MKFTKEKLLDSTLAELKQLLFIVESERNIQSATTSKGRERPTQYRIYLYRKYGSKKVPTCCECKEAQVTITARLEYRPYCENKECLRAFVRKKGDETMLKRYGVKNASQIESVKKKKVETCLRNYGVRYPQQSSKIRAKLRVQNTAKYGVPNVSQVAEVQERRNKTFLKKFGGNPFANDKVKMKIREVCLARYGASAAAQVPEIRAKQQRTLLRNYGVLVPAKSETIRARMQQTNIARFGVPFASQNTEIQTKMANSWTQESKATAESKRRATNTLRYNTESPQGLPENIRKAQTTYEQRTSFSHPSRNPAVRAKTLATWRENHGCDHPMQNPQLFAKVMATGHKVRFAQCDSDKKLPLRGYEPLVVDKLKALYGSSILVGSGVHPSIPEIYYEDKGKKHRYFPDLRIESQQAEARTVLEVKSVFTSGVNSQDLFQVNRKKYRAAQKILAIAGLDFYLCLVATARSEPKFLFVKNPGNLSRMDMLRILDKHGISRK